MNISFGTWSAAAVLWREERAIRTARPRPLPVHRVQGRVSLLLQACTCTALCSSRQPPWLWFLLWHLRFCYDTLQTFFSLFWLTIFSKPKQKKVCRLVFRNLVKEKAVFFRWHGRWFFCCVYSDAFKILKNICPQGSLLKTFSACLTVLEHLWTFWAISFGEYFRQLKGKHISGGWCFLLKRRANRKRPCFDLPRNAKKKDWKYSHWKRWRNYFPLQVEEPWWTSVFHASFGSTFVWPLTVGAKFLQNYIF